MLARLKLKRVFGLGSKKSIPILCLSLEVVLLDFVSPAEKLTKNFDPFLEYARNWGLGSSKKSSLSTEVFLIHNLPPSPTLKSLLN